MPNRAPYHPIGTEPYTCIETENHAPLLTWSTWLVAWIVGCVRPMTKTTKNNVAQHGGHQGCSQENSLPPKVFI